MLYIRGIEHLRVFVSWWAVASPSMSAWITLREHVLASHFLSRLQFRYGNVKPKGGHVKVCVEHRLFMSNFLNIHVPSKPADIDWALLLTMSVNVCESAVWSVPEEETVISTYFYHLRLTALILRIVQATPSRAKFEVCAWTSLMHCEEHENEMKEFCLKSRK